MEANRRQVLGDAAVAGMVKAKTTQAQPDGFFTLGQRDNHWWLVTPNGESFFSLGLNPILIRQACVIPRTSTSGATKHRALGPGVCGT